MPIEIALLAATVVGKILVPFFQRGAAQVGDALGEKVADGAAEFATDTANTLWERIRSRFSKPDEQVIADRFKEDPEVAEKLFEADLKRKLAEDPDFAQEIAGLLEAKSPDGSGDVMTIFGDGGIVDARGAHISGGVVAGKIAGNVYTSSPGEPSQE
jgi:hypothetical protein